MTETASEISRAYRALPSSTRTAAETLCGPNRPVTWSEILLLVARGMEAERERCKVEVDDGSLIVRLGSLSITVHASSAILYDTSKQIPAKKVNLYPDVFFREAEDFLRDQPAPLPATQEEKEQ